jgi:hypothetical protein
MNGASQLAGWQWLFLLEGLPACVLAFAVLKFLPDGPGDASWLSDAEKVTIAARLTAEDATSHHSFARALRDPRVLALCPVGLGPLPSAITESGCGCPRSSNPWATPISPRVSSSRCPLLPA